MTPPGKASASTSIALGDALHTATAGQDCFFVVKARDQTGRPLRTGGFQVAARMVDIVEGTKTACKVKDNHDGTVAVKYLIPAGTEGAFQLDVVLDGRPIRGSPFAVTVHTPSDARKDKAFAIDGSVSDAQMVELQRTLLRKEDELLAGQRPTTYTVEAALDTQLVELQAALWAQAERGRVAKQRLALMMLEQAQRLVDVAAACEAQGTTMAGRTYDAQDLQVLELQRVLLQKEEAQLVERGRGTANAAIQDPRYHLGMDALKDSGRPPTAREVGMMKKQVALLMLEQGQQLAAATSPRFGITQTEAGKPPKSPH